MKYIVLFLFFLIITSGCKKDQHGCTDKNSLNYDPSATSSNQSSCLYAMDSVSGQYKVTIVSYPALPSADGETDEWDFTPGFTCLGSTGQGIQMNALSGPLSDFCTPLNGFSFTFADSQAIYWAAAPLTGTGTFVRDSFFFTGKVTSGNGDSSILLLRGYKYH